MAPLSSCVMTWLPSPPLTAGSFPATILSRWWPKPIVSLALGRLGPEALGRACGQRGHSPWWDIDCDIPPGADTPWRGRARPRRSRLPKAPEGLGLDGRGRGRARMRDITTNPAFDAGSRPHG
jgi:hypothetical protein